MVEKRLIGWGSAEEFREWWKNHKEEGAKKDVLNADEVKRRIKREKEEIAETMYRDEAEERRYRRIVKKLRSMSRLDATRELIRLINEEGPDGRASEKLKKLLREL
jgi:hypothetical protein